MAERSQRTGLTDDDLEDLIEDIKMRLRRAREFGEALSYAKAFVEGYNEGFLDGIHNRQPQYAQNNPAS